MYWSEIFPFHFLDRWITIWYSLYLFVHGHLGKSTIRITVILVPQFHIVIQPLFIYSNKNTLSLVQSGLFLKWGEQKLLVLKYSTVIILKKQFFTLHSRHHDWNWVFQWIHFRIWICKWLGLSVELNYRMNFTAIKKMEYKNRLSM